MTNPSDSQITVTRETRPEGVIATLTIANARRLNSMNSALMTEMVDELGELARERHSNIARWFLEALEYGFIEQADVPAQWRRRWS